MEQRDAYRARLDRRKAALEAVDVLRRLGVRLTEQRLAEVRPLLAEAADESLHSGDTDAHAVDREDRVRAIEDDDSRLGERARKIGRPVGLPVVVPEHRDDRHLQVAARVGDDAHLVDLPVLRQVAREQDQIGLLLDVAEGLDHAIAFGGPGVNVTRGGDTNRLRHTPPLPQEWNEHSRVPTRPVADDEAFTKLLESMKRAAAVLRDNDVPFALAGGLAVYARGGPATEHDIDFIVGPDDAEHALELLGAVGFRTERPAEGWLYKAFDDDDGSMIDLIFSPNHMPEVVPELLDRAEEIEVYAITLKVMTVTDVLTTKLLTLKEHEVDYADVLEIARNCREQVEWDLLRERTEQSPYAKAFFTLVEELGLVEA
jgi:hypothetical protein